MSRDAESWLMSVALFFGLTALGGIIGYQVGSNPKPAPTVVRVLPSQELDPWRVTLEWSDGTFDRRDVSMMWLVDDQDRLVRFER